MKAREVIKMLKEDGWVFKAQKGSHVHFEHPIKIGKVTVPDHGSKDIAKGTLNSILKQAGFK
jgi:predicted RNA binding protein YcfA (HicA-like mRNA interferase family)